MKDNIKNPFVICVFSFVLVLLFTTAVAVVIDYKINNFGKSEPVPKHKYLGKGRAYLTDEEAVTQVEERLYDYY